MPDATPAPEPEPITTTAAPDPGAPARAARAPGRVAAWIGLAIALVLIAAAMIIPAATGWNVRVRWFPPLHAEWMPRLGPGTIAAVVLGGLAIAYAARIARRARFGWLLLWVYLAASAWLLSLALVDGLDGIGVILDTQYEYMNTARAVTDFGATLQEYISRIPLDSVDNWPVHIAGHPPGALLFFYLLVQVGLDTGLAAGFAVLFVAATTPVAVLLTLRRLGAEDSARLAAPFLVFGPAAIWMAVSGDGMFAAVAAWGICALAYSATAASRGAMIAWSAASGLILGYCVMLSYGLPLLGVLAVTVLVIGRTWKPLPGAIIAALAVVLAFAAAGFAWWEAYPVLVERYWAGIATRRPIEYWIWGNFAALAFSAGPLVGAAVAVAIARVRGFRTLSPVLATTVLLALAGFAMVVLADLSGMSKAEVERIWLPFVPWMLVGTALLPPAWRRPGLVLQVVFALVVQHLLFTGW
jgi:hypothetical protein